MMKIKLLWIMVVLISYFDLSAQRNMEFLNRGMVGLKTADKSVFLSWRLLGTDDYETAFTLYRQQGDGPKQKLNRTPLIKGTNFLDQTVDLKQEVIYTLALVQAGKEVEVGQ